MGRKQGDEAMCITGVNAPYATIVRVPRLITLIPLLVLLVLPCEVLGFSMDCQVWRGMRHFKILVKDNLKFLEMIENENHHKL